MYDLSSPNLSPLLIEEATRTVEQLIKELKGDLDHNQRWKLHRLRLACESLGMLRAATQALGTLPDPRASWSATRR